MSKIEVQADGVLFQGDRARYFAELDTDYGTGSAPAGRAIRSFVPAGIISADSGFGGLFDNALLIPS